MTPTSPTPNTGSIPRLDRLETRDDFSRLMLSYKFGLDEVLTKVNILKEEFSYIHDYSPIEHVHSRLKSPESILKKALRKKCPLTVDDIRTQISDIAGIRITCSFVADTYIIRDLLSRQDDITVIEVKDYIESPKPNGYQSLHLIVEVPVFMSDRVEPVRVEIQIRTVAMDFWASVEHKIYYKYEGAVPDSLLDELREAARAVNRLDVKMEGLYDEVVKINKGTPAAQQSISLSELQQLPLPEGFLNAFIRHREQG